MAAAQHQQAIFHEAFALNGGALEAVVFGGVEARLREEERLIDRVLQRTFIEGLGRAFEWKQRRVQQLQRGLFVEQLAVRRTA